MAGKGRPVCTETALGRRLVNEGLTAYQVAARTDISPRLMTEYLAGRRRFKPEHLAALCRVLVCEPEELQESEPPHNITNSQGLRIPGVKTLEELQEEQAVMRQPRTA